MICRYVQSVPQPDVGVPCLKRTHSACHVCLLVPFGCFLCLESLPDVFLGVLDAVAAGGGMSGARNDEETDHLHPHMMGLLSRGSHRSSNDEHLADVFNSGLGCGCFVCDIQSKLLRSCISTGEGRIEKEDYIQRLTGPLWCLTDYEDR